MKFDTTTKCVWSIVSLLINSGLGASNDCSCGYSINTAGSPNYTVYTQLLETDFLHLYTVKDNPCWQPQEYNVTAVAARGAEGQYATLKNVVPNPFTTWDTWSGQGVLGGDAGLRLWVNSTIVDGMVPMGEIDSSREDILYGSYRVNMKVTGIPGTCGAFFWYRNNSEEIDMEFLSSSYNSSSTPVFLVMQTPESVAADYNAANTSTYQIAPLPFVPDQGFHEYRFDWSPNKVTFYVDGQWLQDLYWTYPQAPGHLALNHWSNGNTQWSQGPPQEDAVLTVSYVKAYFNTTNQTVNQEYDSSCKNVSNVCQIPDSTTSASAAGSSSFFFQRGMCGEKVSATGAGASSQAASPRLAAWLVPQTTIIFFSLFSWLFA